MRFEPETEKNGSPRVEPVKDSVKAIAIGCIFGEFLRQAWPTTQKRELLMSGIGVFVRCFLAFRGGGLHHLLTMGRSWSCEDLFASLRT